MKRVLLLIVFSVSFVATEAHARAGVHYILPKVTAMFFDVNPQTSKPLYTAGVLYGYGVDSAVALEFDANYGVYGGEYTEGGADGSISSWNLGIYGVYRYPVLVEGYLKGKVGGAYVKMDHSAAVGDDTNKEGLEVVLGAGFGYVFKSRITLELEYTRLKNYSHNLGLGVHYPF